MNAYQLYKDIPDETAAVRYLQKLGLIPETKECENSHEMKLCVSTVIRWRCFLRGCRKQVGVPANKELSGKRMKKELELDPGTTVDWNSLLRERSLPIYGEEGGKKLTVDETIFSRRKNNCGRILPQQWCFGRICKETKECFVEPVANKASETLMKLLKKTVASETLIISDMWRSYSQVSDSGYEHLELNHKYNFVDPLTNAHTQNIERVWRSVKERSKKHCGTRKSMLEDYMYEFT
ncbi:Transposase, ISXO2-like domain-containing protein [Strongyloides ratti]|uniref:Transposase, ISXO2-like domain-containing protein n=1 Tax=Strongyloides ratti TaxID=34506 RepID=A0A090MTE1_STRRB|nr:Transposase, ISXO2-like domain-containing protein [Strongyloides ratti]CEF61588.1 Transposase, ISXO2-like domain-containing protein [Strongyloides ratti]